MRLDDLLRDAGTDAKLMARAARRTPTASVGTPSGDWWKGLVVAGSLVVLAWAMFAGTGAEPSPVADTVQPEEPVVTTLLSELEVIPTEAPQVWVVADGWQALPPPPLRMRQGHTVVWTGDEVIFWGGFGDSEYYGGPSEQFLDGAAFDPETGAWRLLKEPPSSWGVFDRNSAVWTGSEMVIWGGNWIFGGSVGKYDPASDEWRIIAGGPIGDLLYGNSGTWTGKELIIWGDDGLSGPTGAAYDPANDSWRVVADSPLTNRSLHSAVWTGSELIIWGGTSDDNGDRDGDETQRADGAAYDPVTDTWRVIAPSPLVARRQHTAVWTGSEMIVWGGAASDLGFDALEDGAAYDPATDEWRMLPTAPIEARSVHTAVWTSRGMLVWGGQDRNLAHIGFVNGAVFDPATNAWSQIPPSGGFWSFPSVWTGNELVSWGRGGEEFEAGGGVFRFPPEESTDPASTIEKYAEAFNADDIDGIMELFSEESVITRVNDVSGAGGLREIRGYLTHNMTAENAYTISNVEVNGTTVTWDDSWTSVGGDKFCSAGQSAVVEDGVILSWAQRDDRGDC